MDMLSTSVDSPYKSLLAEIDTDLNASNEEKYFKSPEMKRVPKPFAPKPQSSNRKKTNTKKQTKNMIIQSVKDNFQQTDVNPEHLQMALALSKSMSETETISNVEDEVTYKAAYNSTQKNVGKFKQTLMEFGFKCDRPKVKGEHFGAYKKNKKSKFKFITPTLLVRTQEERKMIISSKISSILNESQSFINLKQNQATSDDLLNSAYLKTCVSSAKNIFTINTLDLDQLITEENKFYIDKLDIPRIKTKCGSLLRDWKSIAGRESTSSRETIVNTKETVEQNIMETSAKTNLEMEMFPNRSISPDLFESDDEKHNTVSAECLKNDLGIYHIESFCKDPVSLAEDCVDLTQSSDDENEVKRLACLDQENTASCSMNVTDYVYEILNTKTEADNSHQEFNKSQKHLVKSNESDTSVSNISNQRIRNSCFSSSTSENAQLSDEELHYSCIYSTPKRTEQFSKFRRDANCDEPHCSNLNMSVEYFENSIQYPEIQSPHSVETPETNSNTPETTPSQKIILKTENVTPMLNYDTLNTPTIQKELHKYGLRPLKRQRGTQMLKYIYEMTHPLVGVKGNGEEAISDNEVKIVKSRRIANSADVGLKETAANCSKSTEENVVRIIGDLLLENESLENLIFERNRSSRIASCKLPLQIAWYNLLSFHPEIEEKILQYEPLQLNELYTMFKNEGYKYHIEDILTFLDRKCITVRTNQKPYRVRKRRKKQL